MLADLQHHQDLLHHLASALRILGQSLLPELGAKPIDFVRVAKPETRELVSLLSLIAVASFGSLGVACRTCDERTKTPLAELTHNTSQDELAELHRDLSSEAQKVSSSVEKYERSSLAVSPAFGRWEALIDRKLCVVRSRLFVKPLASLMPSGAAYADAATSHHIKTPIAKAIATSPLPLSWAMRSSHASANFGCAQLARPDCECRNI